MSLPAIHVLVALTCAVVVHGAGISRGSCERSAAFKVSTGYKLSGHVIETRDVTSSQDCGIACLGTSGCKSYNYQEAGSPLHACQLSSQSKASTPSSDYVTDAGYSYCDADQYVLPGCASLSCQNGGTCQIAGCTNDYVCQCTEEFSGEKCELWIGFDGSSSSRPGHSCGYIKKYGKSNADKKYWIDPTRSGSPFLVKCDMTTDGGGWTLIRSIRLSSSSPLTGQSVQISDYTKLNTLAKTEYLTSGGLNSFKTAIGFQQLRYYCHKASTSKTIHIKTAMNATGFNAVRYLITNPSPLARACGSYDRLPDDNSVLSRIGYCDKWGYVSGNGQINKWGHSGYIGGYRPYHRFMFWLDASRSFAMLHHLLWCDDEQIDNLSAGDKWAMYVR